jgi:hypothetical protein
MLDKIAGRFQPKKRAGVSPVAAGAVGAIAGAAVATYLSKNENREKLKTALNQATSKAQKGIDTLTNKKREAIREIETSPPLKDSNVNKKIAI